MKRFACTFWLAAWCCLLASAQAIRFPTPTDFQTHFEPNTGAAPDSGSRDGWESFPLSQEAGYDPSIQPETRNGESVLVRELAPTRDGFFQLGFVRRVHLITGKDAAIRFRLRVPYLTQTARAHLHVFRGEADEQHELNLTGGAWQELSTPLNVSAIPITAIAVAVDFPDAVHTRSERVMLTSLHLHGLAPKHLPISQPATLWDSSRELFYLQRSVSPGDRLAIHTSTSDSHWSLTSPNGSVVVHGIGATLLFTFPPNAQCGVWTAHMENADAESTALVLLRSAVPAGLIFDSPPTITPQLLSSIRERKATLERVTTPGAGRNIAFMNPEWLLPGLPSYFAELLQPSELALMNAMLFRATGDRAALASAQALLRDMASWPTWVHPWFPAHGYHSYYPVGLMTKYIIMSEEFLGPDLPLNERTALDRSLLKLSIAPIYEEYVREDRLQFDTSNWIGNTVGGALLAALESGDPDTGGYALGLFTKERNHIAAAYTADGSYGEGVTYHRFDLETTELAAAASKRLLGINLDANLLNGERYMRYAAYNSTALLDYGDSHVDLKPSNVLAYVASLNNCAATSEFYLRNREEGTTQILPRVLWELSIHPVSSRDPGSTSALFSERGIAVMRDSWNLDSTVIAMRAGKNFNHNHADEGSLFYAAKGILWMGESGYADYYKDPFYSTYNIQAFGHNTLLVDGNPESQTLPGNAVFGSWPKFTNVRLREEASIAQADLTTVYPGLTHYVRSLIHLTNGPTLVVDDISSSKPHTFTTVWHPEEPVRAVHANDSSLELASGDDQLLLCSYADAELVSSLQEGPLPLTAYHRSEHDAISRPMLFEVTTKKPSTHALMLTVLAPGKSSALATNATWKTTGDTVSLTVAGWSFRFARTSRHTLSIAAVTPTGANLDLTASLPEH